MAIEQSNTSESKSHFGVTNPETRAKAMTLPLEDLAEIIDGCLDNQAEQSRILSDQIAAIKKLTNDKKVNTALQVIATSTRAWDNDLCDTGAYLEALLNKAVASQQIREGGSQPSTMAAPKTAAMSENDGSEVPCSSFAGDLGYELHLLRFRADAASALLHEYGGVDADERLVGVSYMLTDIAKLANELAERLGESSFTYVSANKHVAVSNHTASAQH